VLEGRKIAVAVTGGIASYKSCLLVRELIRANAIVRVLMTRSACEFITPLTLKVLSGNPVVLDTYSSAHGDVSHIDLAKWADVLIVAPATANTLAKAAHGIADNIVTTTILATRVPVVFAPAMNTGMWENAATIENILKLRERGALFVEPEYGSMASQKEEDGMGRLASEEDLLDGIRRALIEDKQLAGIEMLISAGRTDEYFDPVRMISNRSTGKMGFALAKMASFMGAKVNMVSGPTSLKSPRGVTAQFITSAREMYEYVMDAYPENGVLIMAAAVSDFRPAHILENKLKKDSDDKVNLRIEPNPDILLAAAARKRKGIHVGFAVETENELENARNKLIRKKLDLIVVNNPNTPGAGFAHETNKARILHADGSVEDLALKSKLMLAKDILERVAALANKGV